MKRIAGWPEREGLVASVTSHPCTPVSCERLLRVGADMDREVFESALQAVEHLSGTGAAFEVLRELAATIHERDGYVPTPGTLLALWDMQVRCGALLAMLTIGCENAGGWRLLDYIRTWRNRGVTVRHAVWHIADGNPDPESIRRHPARGCTPDAFMTVWALAGRATNSDYTLSEAFYWLRAVHAMPATA